MSKGKVIGVVLGVSALFAVVVKAGNIDKDFSFETYITNITENVKPFPSFPSFSEYVEGGSDWDIAKNFFKWVGASVSYPVKLIGVVTYNLGLILGGLFDFGGLSDNQQVGESGAGDNFGGFAGGGHGGGGGGGR